MRPHLTAGLRALRSFSPVALIYFYYSFVLVQYLSLSLNSKSLKTWVSVYFAYYFTSVRPAPRTTWYTIGSQNMCSMNTLASFKGWNFSQKKRRKSFQQGKAINQSVEKQWVKKLTGTRKTLRDERESQV